MAKKYDIVIVGAGTAGLSAAIYAVRAGKSVIVLEATTHGGQIVNTPEVENYPGIKKISGFEFANNLYEQAKSLGAEVVYEKVNSIEVNGEEKIVHTAKEDYQAKAVILATGAKNRPLGLEHEKEWIGAGISYCATCDGMFYRGKDVAVAGGGNTALEDAIFLTNYCRKVYLIHRRDAFRGEEKLLQTLKEKPNVEFVLNANITRLIGEDGVDGVEVEDKNTHEKRVLDVMGLFVAIGQMPENSEFINVVDLDKGGYIEAKEDCKTKTKGIFTAGDCRTKKVRQLATAASDGAIAALAACEYIG
ncbi:thioredoxin-disulfide reductase [Lachnospiraceae bacterium oral taxon 096]|nr:thioredoxin-disulfide reductase [Lachnospiraceae bacterium oral taxon 096]QUI96004.1 thioredoxin-disulfide reductase [Lachnospiraceae bacterium oral taxon 096]